MNPVPASHEINASWIRLAIAAADCYFLRSAAG